MPGFIDDSPLDSPRSISDFLQGFMRGIGIREEYVTPVFDSKDNIWYFPRLVMWKVLIIPDEDARKFNLLPFRKQIPELINNVYKEGVEDRIFDRRAWEMLKRLNSIY